MYDHQSTAVLYLCVNSILIYHRIYFVLMTYNYVSWALKQVTTCIPSHTQSRLIKRKCKISMKVETHES